MKIALSSSGNSLDSQIDPRFGRCAYFIIVETENMSFEAFVNKCVASGGGAGIQAAQFVADKGVNVVITGHVGPNAVQTLSAAHVEIISELSGTIRDAIEKFKTGNMASTKRPNVSGHYGMAGRNGLGRGMGMGRGGFMGGGMAMGRGQGMRQGKGGPQRGGSDQPGRAATSKEDELKRLKDQGNELLKQIKAIESSIHASAERK